MTETTTALERHWASPEWRAEVLAWIDDALAAHGIARTGEVEQPRLRMWATSLTVPTDRGRFWFKENCPGQAFEAGLVDVLARLVPDQVVPPLAVQVGRGWMLSPDHGAVLGSLDRTDEAMWTRVVTEYADLQRATVDHRDELVGAGLDPVLPAGAADHLAHRLDALGALPVGHPRRIEPALNKRLNRGLPRLAELGTLLADGPVPCALDHNDLHHNNAFLPVAGETRLRFFDFGDAVWAHPFGSMRVTLNVITDEWKVGDDDPAVRRIVDAYLERWSDLAPVAELRPLFDAALVLARLHRFVSWERCLVDVRPEEMGDWGESPVMWLERLAEALDVA